MRRRSQNNRQHSTTGMWEVEQCLELLPRRSCGDQPDNRSPGPPGRCLRSCPLTPKPDSDRNNPSARHLSPWWQELGWKRDAARKHPVADGTSGGIPRQSGSNAVAAELAVLSRWASIFRMTAGSSILAIMRTSPPHFSQVSTSIWKTRFNRFAHVIEARFSAGVWSAP